MASLGTPVRRPSIIGRFDVWLAMLSVAVLGFMMVFVCAGVVLRYVFNAPIAGTNEVLELASVAFVMLALPYTTRQDAHIRIDLIDGFLGRVALAITDILYRVIGVLVLWFLVRANIARMLDAFEYSDTTNMIALPLWPFYGLIALGMGLYALILAVQMIAILIPRGRSDD